jgi:hypothetical protein
MTDLYGMTVSELDEILDELDLDKTGLKADKVSRIEDYLDSDNNIETPMVGAETPEVAIETEREVVESLAPFTVRMWSGIKPVYACTLCDRQEDNKDDAILHYLDHYPEHERESILNKLVKDK